MSDKEKRDESESLVRFETPSLFDEYAGVRQCYVTRGLWVSRHVGFQG